MSTFLTTGSCDPHAAVKALLDSLKGAAAAAAHAAAAFPDPLECLTVGTAESASINLYPGGYNPYDLASVRQRVGTIFDSVSRAGQDDLRQLQGFQRPLRQSGLWLSKDVAETFHGLVLARAEQAGADAVLMQSQADMALRLCDDLLEAISGVSEASMAEVASGAAVMEEVVGPQACAIADEIRAAGKEVGTGCGATSLLKKIAAMTARLPRPDERVARVVQASNELADALSVLGATMGEVVAVKRLVPGFEEQIEAANYSPPTEEALHDAIAAEMKAVCDTVKELAAQGRRGEMQALVPQLQEIAAIAVDTLSSDPGTRVGRVRAHRAHPAYQTYADRLRATEEPDYPFQAAADLQAEVAQSIFGWNDAVRSGITDIQSRVGAITGFAKVVQEASLEFSDAAKKFTDQLCVGVLRRLIEASGYKELERRFLDGLFGEIPSLSVETATTAGALSKCLNELGCSAGSLPLAGAQRFAMERLSQAASISRRASEFVAEAARKIDGVQKSFSAEIDELVKSIQKDARAALGFPPLKVGVPDASEVFSRLGVPGVSLPACLGAVRPEVDPDGWIKAGDGPLPEGMARDPSGYVYATDYSVPLPPGYNTVGTRPPFYLRSADPVLAP